MENLDFNNINLDYIDNQIESGYKNNLKKKIEGDIKFIEESILGELDIIALFLEKEKKVLLEIVRLAEDYSNNTSETKNFIQKNNFFNYLDDINPIVLNILDKYFTDISDNIYKKTFRRIRKEYLDTIYSYIGGENKQYTYGLKLTLKEYLSPERYNKIENYLEEIEKRPKRGKFREGIETFFKSLNEIIQKDIIKDFIRGLQEKEAIDKFLEKEKEKGIEKVKQFIEVRRNEFEKAKENKEVCLLTNYLSYYGEDFTSIKDNYIGFINKNLSIVLLISMFIDNPDDDKLLYRISNISKLVDITRNFGIIGEKLKEVFHNTEIKKKLVTVTWNETMLNKKTILLEDFTINELLSLVDKEDIKKLKKIVTKITISVGYKDYEYYSNIKVYFRFNNIEEKLNKIKDLVSNNK